MHHAPKECIVIRDEGYDCLAVMPSCWESGHALRMEIDERQQYCAKLRAALVTTPSHVSNVLQVYSIRTSLRFLSLKKRRCCEVARHLYPLQHGRRPAH